MKEKAMRGKIVVDYDTLFDPLFKSLESTYDANTARHVADAYVHGFENTLNLPGIAEYVKKLLSEIA
jgi:hypothetical protein